MSLVPAFVQTQEGSWVRQPVITTPDGWFVCWDDDEPIELVVRSDLDPLAIVKQLRDEGWPVFLAGPGNADAYRYLDGKLSDTTCKSFWLSQHSGPPEAMLTFTDPPTDRKPRKEGVYFPSAPILV